MTPTTMCKRIKELRVATSAVSEQIWDLTSELRKLYPEKQYVDDNEFLDWVAKDLMDGKIIPPLYKREYDND